MSNHSTIFLAPADKLISHSSRQQWYTCPRKFQLSKTKSFHFREKEVTKALSFGKAFGTGIQSLLAGDSLDTALIKSMLDADKIESFSSESIKSGESLAHIHEAIQSFYYGQLEQLKADWTVLDIPEIYGVELAFAMEYPNGTWERGYLDLALQNKFTNEVIVIEVKTSGANVVGTDASWANSPQGIIYLIVLEYLMAQQGIITNNQVIFLEYNKPHKKYTVFPFVKPPLERMRFLLSLWQDVQARAAILDSGFPAFKTGKCVSYNRQCEYFGVCDLSINLEYPEVEINPAKVHIIKFKDVLSYLQEKVNAELRSI